MGPSVLGIFLLFCLGLSSAQRGPSSLDSLLRRLLPAINNRNASANANAVGPAADPNLAPRYAYDKVPVEFDSQSVRIKGLLFVPRGLDRRVPAVTITGPILFVKEQAPLQYATRLAERGLVALIYDHRNHGESEGQPRRWEAGQLKREDISASIDFLQTRPEVDPEKIIMLGVCMGATWALQSAAFDPRIKAVGTVAGFYVNRGDWELMFGGSDAFERRVRQGKEAMDKFRRNRQVDYLPVVDQHRQDVLLPKEFIWGWYQGWPTHSNWENRYAVMSHEDLLATDVEPAIRELRKPWLMVHSDRSNNPDNALRMHAAAPASEDKQTRWMGDEIHTNFYDQPDTIDTAVNALYSFWADKLRLWDLNAQPNH